MVFLDAAERRWVEELGGMNIFFVLADGTLLTPPLGTILPGITRASVIDLARAAGRPVEEAPYDVGRWRGDAESGRLAEVFVCGTAATVAAVAKVCDARGKFTVGDGEVGPVTRELGDRLRSIQRGEGPDPFGWRHPIAGGTGG